MQDRRQNRVQGMKGRGDKSKGQGSKVEVEQKQGARVQGGMNK